MFHVKQFGQGIVEASPGPVPSALLLAGRKVGEKGNVASFRRVGIFCAEFTRIARLGSADDSISPARTLAWQLVTKAERAGMFLSCRSPAGCA